MLVSKVNTFNRMKMKIRVFRPKRKYLDQKESTWTEKKVIGPKRKYLDQKESTWTKKKVLGPKRKYLDKYLDQKEST